MRKRLLLRGTELRYALTLHLIEHGRTTVPDLIDALERDGFEIAGRASKTVSDALRWEVGRDRVRRLKRGRYGPGSLPRSTEYRIRARMAALRGGAAEMNAAADDAFWKALGA